MKKFYFASTAIISTLAAVFLFSSFSLFGGKKKNSQDQRAKTVVVYAYDSFAGEWGPGPKLVKLFKQKTGYDLTMIDCGDAGQATSRAILEKSKPQADVLLGADNNLITKLAQADILESYKPKGAENLIDTLEDSLGGNWTLTPYDYSHFAIIFDTESNVAEPKSLADLTKSEYEKKLILMDPRTSTPGLGFVAWTRAIYGDKAIEYWKELKSNILTMAPGWSAGYGLFTSGEAPLVISYTTSPAYHYEEDKSTRFKTLIFEEGHPMQVEGAGLLKGAINEKGAKAFLDFLISEEAQSVLPLTQWMYPANKNVKLPECYEVAAPKAAKTLITSSDDVEKAKDEVVSLLTK